MLYKVVLTFQSVDESDENVIIQLKTLDVF